MPYLVFALSAHFATPWLWNNALYPSIVKSLPFAQISYSAFPILACILLIGSARKCKPLAKESVIPTLGGLILTPIGTALTVLFIMSNNSDTSILVFGIGLFGLGRFFAFLVIGINLLHVNLKTIATAVSASLFLSGLYAGLIALMPIEFSYIATGLLESAAIVACLIAAPMMSQCAPLERFLSTNGNQRMPASFPVPHGGIPLSFLAAIATFFLVFGFSGMYFPVSNTSGRLFFLLSFVPLVLPFSWMLTHPKSFPLDQIYRASLIMTCLGFAAIAFPEIIPPDFASAVVMAGSHFFVVIYWTALCSASQRHPSSIYASLTWGRLFASSGTLLGVILAIVILEIRTINSQVESLLAVSTALLYAIIAITVLKNVDFIELSIKRNPESSPINHLAKKHNLTPRETEVLALLAKGRNAQHIQEALLISKNTTKTHMKHIYSKMNVHTQQELLSLIERQSTSDTDNKQ